MDQPTFDPTPRARSAAGHRMSAAVLRVVTRLVVGSSLAVSVAGGVALFANAAHAGEADGPIVIAGPNEQNPAALAALAERMQATPAKRTGSAHARRGHRAIAGPWPVDPRRRSIRARR